MDQVVACLAREEGFESVVGQVGVVLHHTKTFCPFHSVTGVAEFSSMEM